MMSRAHSRLMFQSRKVEDDGHGNTVGDFANRFEARAKVTPRLGGESVLAARLAGTQTVQIMLRSNPTTRQITTDWRAYDMRDISKVYNIRSAVNPDGRNKELELLAETGVAT